MKVDVQCSEQIAKVLDCRNDDGDRRVVVIAASILVARHLKTLEEFRDSKPSPRNQALIANAVEWAERILQHVNKA
jgi:hypothetical protein